VRLGTAACNRVAASKAPKSAVAALVPLETSPRLVILRDSLSRSRTGKQALLAPVARLLGRASRLDSFARADLPKRVLDSFQGRSSVTVRASERLMCRVLGTVCSFRFRDSPVAKIATVVCQNVTVTCSARMFGEREHMDVALASLVAGHRPQAKTPFSPEKIYNRDYYEDVAWRVRFTSPYPTNPTTDAHASVVRFIRRLLSRPNR
jgi:hypothetical protein